jgi:Catalase
VRAPPPQVKFYTREGNYDMVGNNMPVFFVRDGMKFPDMVHALKPNPKNHIQARAAPYCLYLKTLLLLLLYLLLTSWVACLCAGCRCCAVACYECSFGWHAASVPAHQSVAHSRPHTRAVSAGGACADFSLLSSGTCNRLMRGIQCPPVPHSAAGARAPLACRLQLCDLGGMPALTCSQQHFLLQEFWRIWDFFSHHPESCHMFMFLLDDVGIPLNYRHMPGFGVHTFKLLNKAGQEHYVKFHWLPKCGAAPAPLPGVDLYSKVEPVDELLIALCVTTAS